MSVQVKICGLTTSEAVTAALRHGAIFMGFVFFGKSPRNVTPKKAAELSKDVPSSIKKVAVLVDPSDKDIDTILAEFTPDYLQLHGNETIERVKEIRSKYKIPVIKAVKIRSGDDVAMARSFVPVSDMLMFDSKAPTEGLLPGGNGLRFDWSLLGGRVFDKPWFLSGGLNVENVAEAVRITNAKMVDVSSSLENEPGKKDPELVKQFLNKVKAIK